MSKIKPSYRRGVECIALNDEPDDLDVEDVQHYVSVGVLAAAFGKEPIEVARSVVNLRKRARKEGWF